MPHFSSVRTLNEESVFLQRAEGVNDDDIDSPPLRFFVTFKQQHLAHEFQFMLRETAGSIRMCYACAFCNPAITMISLFATIAVLEFEVTLLSKDMMEWPSFARFDQFVPTPIRSFDDYTPRCTLVCDNMPDWGIHEHCVVDYIKGKLNTEDYDSIVDCIAFRENVLGNNGGASVVLIQFHCADWADIVYNTRQDLK
eukprot:3607-Heterococcus_DN1.PRE.2